jgi:hypothetical protein
LKRKRPTIAKVYAFKFTIICPKCNDAVKDAKGGVVWHGTLPGSVQCQTCGRVSRVGRKIHPD